MFGSIKKADPEPQREREDVSISSEDDSLTRARKVWRLLGFVNDRFDATTRLAFYLETFTKWDRAARYSDGGEVQAATPAPTVSAGCICPPTSEQTCQNALCPRKSFSV